MQKGLGFSLFSFIGLHLNLSIHICSTAHFHLIDISTLDIYPPTIQFLICTSSRLHDPRTQQATVASCWIITTVLSHRGRRVTPRITQRPFVLDRCPASDTHGGCTRQAALRARGTPGAAPALLLRRIPGKARTEGEGIQAAVDLSVREFFVFLQ